MPRALSVYRATHHGRKEWRAQIPDPREGGRLRYVMVFAGTGIPRSKRTRAKAEQLAQEILDRWDREAGTTQRDQLTLLEFLALAKGDPGKPRIGDTLSPESIIRRNKILTHFGDWMTARFGVVVGRDEHGETVRELPVGSIEPIMVDAYLQNYREVGTTGKPREKPRKETGVQRIVCALKRAWAFGATRNLVSRSPIVYTPRQKSLDEWRDQVRRRAFTDDELDALFAAFRDGYVVERDVESSRHGQPVEYQLQFRHRPELWIRDALELALHTGLRAGAVRTLRWQGVDFERRLIHYSGKNGKQVTLMNRACHDLLRRLRAAGSGAGGYVLTNTEGEPLTSSCLRQAVERLFRGVGLKGRSFHSCRHWKGLQLAEAGVPIHRIMQILGLTQLETVKWYVKDEIESFADEYWSQDPLGGQKQARPFRVVKRGGDTA